MSSLELKVEDELQSIQLLFRDFLRMFKDDKGNFKYMERIRDMIINEKRSLQIDYEDLIRFNPKLIDIIEENPDLALQAFSESIKDIVAQEAPDYAEKVPKFYARLNGWVKITPIRGIRSEHVNKLVAIEGIIVRATPPKQKLYKARFVHILPNGEQHEFDWPPGPNEEMSDEIEKPSYCPVCVASMSEEEGRRGKGVFKLIIEKSKFRDYQLIVVQERPEEVPAGQIPRSIEVTLTDDIVDIARPGDRVTIIGVVRLAKGPKRSVKPIFNVYIEANNIIVAQRLLEELKLSPEDEEKIRELGKDPLIRRKIIASIAPTIYGMWDIKEAVALLLFGGVPKIAPDGTKIRGEIHVLLVGDPGTAKSLCFSEPILLLDKSGRIRFRPIGEVVDEYMRKYRAYVRRSKDTEVLNLNEVGEELYTISISPSTLQPEIKRVRALIRHKAPQEVIVVRTKTGRITVITEDHSLVAYDGRKLRPVKPDEAFKNKFLIPILTRIPLSTKRSLIHEVMVGRRKVPLDIDFGYLVGCFIGNGAVIKATAEEKVEIRTTDFNVAKRLVRIVKDKLSVKAKVYVRKTSRRRLWKISINDQDIVKWFKSNLYDNIRCKRRSKHLVKCKVIPEFAYNAPKDFIAGVIHGLIDSKGRILTLKLGDDEKVREGILIAAVNRKLAQGVSLLLSLLGNTHIIRHGTLTYDNHKLIHYSILILSTNVGNMTRSKNDYKALTVAERAKALIGIMDKASIPTRSSSLMGVLDINRSSHIPHILNTKIRDRVQQVHVGIKFYRHIAGGLRFLVDKNDTSIVQSLVKEFDLMNNRYISWDVIESISKVKITEVEPEHSDYVYDIAVEDNENFAGGLGLIILHNSQILQYVARIAPRGIYTTGKGSSAAGLTAAVIRDKQTGEYFLEAGAMVLADGGIVCIDEIDKMRDEDRTAIHEAMEQGTVSIAKAGIVARLNARASVLAAGNPKRGRYIPTLGLSENINLPVTILSRFDLIFVLKDVAEINWDRSLVKYVLKIHETFAKTEPEIPPDLLRKYIAYARKYVKPKLTEEAEKLIMEYYIELRKKSAENPEAPLAITTRQLEALIRLAEAHARMALKDKVEAEDAAEAVRLMNTVLERVGMDVETGTLDIDTIMVGKPKSLREKEIAILNIIKDYSAEDEERKCIKLKKLKSYAEKLGIDEHTLERIIRSLRRSGDIIELRPGCYAPVE